MTDRRPLALNAGEVVELPAGDVLLVPVSRSTTGLFVIGDGLTSSAVQAIIASGEYGLYVASDIAFRVIDDAGVSMPYMGDVLLIEGATPATPPATTVRMYADTTPTVGWLNDAGEVCPVKLRDPGGIGSYGIAGDGTTSSGFRINGYRIGSGANNRVASGDRLLRLAGGGNSGTGSISLENVVLDFEGDGSWDGTADTPSRAIFRAVADGSGSLADILGIYGTGQQVKALRNGKRLDTDFVDHTETTVTRASSAAEQDLASFTVDPATIAAGDRLHFRAAGDLLVNSGTPTLVWRFYVGAAVTASPADSPAVNANRRNFVVDLVVTFLDTVDASCTVEVDGLIRVSNAGTADMVLDATSLSYTVENNLTAVDLSSSFTVRLTKQFSVNNAAVEARLRHAYLRRLAV